MRCCSRPARNATGLIQRNEYTPAFHRQFNPRVPRGLLQRRREHGYRVAAHIQPAQQPLALSEP